MRIAFISDIHGNLNALEAVLADLQTQKVDEIICLGDTITLGPQPKEVLNILRNLNCTLINGNHDGAVLNPEHAEQFEITEYLVPDLYWCREKLTEEDFDFIRSFKATHELVFPNGVSTLCFHGSPLSTTHLIQATTPTNILDEYFSNQTADIFIGGHSHIQMYRRYGEKLILNSGSVGNAFKFVFSPGTPPSLLPWAEYTILSQSGDTLDVDLRRVYFDTDKLLKKVMESEMPGSAWWLRQYQK